MMATDFYPGAKLYSPKFPQTSEATPWKINSESKKTLNVSRHCKIHMWSFLFVKKLSMISPVSLYIIILHCKVNIIDEFIL